MKTITFSIKFNSDWHIGTGGGHFGHIDKTFDRDEDGLPFIPAKSLTGLLRHSMSQIAFGLDQSSVGPWNDLARWILGTEPNLANKQSTFRDRPRPSHLAMQRAMIGSEAASRITNNPWYISSLPVIRPGVRLDEAGTAMDHHLRFIEMAPSGLTLIGSCVLPDSATDKVVALVVSSLRNIRAIGHSRRRGSGSCVVEIISGESGLSQKDLTNEPTIPVSGSPEGKSLTYADSGDDAIFELVIRTLSPVLIPRSTKGNEVESRETIPGSTLLALIASVAPKSVFAAIKQGKLSVGEGLPSVGESQVIPVPLSWVKSKTKNDDNIRNILGQQSANGTDQLKQVRRGFASLNGSSWNVFQPKQVSRSHNTIEDLKQRPTEDVGGLFTYRALAQGQVFRSRVLINLGVIRMIEEESGVSNFLHALSGEHRIGTSRKDDYGHVDITVRRIQDEDQNTPEGDLVLLLTSPALIDNGYGRLTASTQKFVDCLAEQLSAHIELVGPVVTRRERRESFQAKWSLPRPTVCGLQSGSVFKISSPSLSQDQMKKLRDLGEHGIGLRTAEGYGRFVVNHPSVILGEISIQEVVQESDWVTYRPSQQENSSDMIVQIAERAMRQLIDEKIKGVIASGRFGETLGFAGGRPGRSQLGSMRSVIRFSGDDPELLKKWWDGLLSVSNRKKKWPAKTQSTITELLSDTSQIWKIIGVSGQQIEEIFDVAVLGNETMKSLKVKMANSATLAFLASSCRAAQKGLGVTDTEDDEDE